MILQLPFFLNVSFDKYVDVKDQGFDTRKLFKTSRKLKKKLCISIGKKLPKINDKTKKKIRGFD